MKFQLLPPASEGWGKVIFSVCSHLRGGGVTCPGLDGGRGYPIQVWMVGGYPISGLGWGVPHLRSGVGGYPISGQRVPHLRFGMGGTPSQVWGGGYPISGLGWGVPHLRYRGDTSARSGYGGVPRVPLPDRSRWWGGTQGTPTIKTWLGYPPPTIKTWLGYSPPWDGVPPTIKTWLGYPHPGMGYPPTHPHPWDGYPPQHGTGYPPTWPPPRQSSIASTCYAAGGVPLAFTQEDFLVLN